MYHIVLDLVEPVGVTTIIITITMPSLSLLLSLILPYY